MSKEKVNPEDLKCCGNCMEYYTCDRFNDACQWCEQWQWDTMTKDQREKERLDYED